MDTKQTGPFENRAQLKPDNSITGLAICIPKWQIFSSEASYPDCKEIDEKVFSPLFFLNTLQINFSFCHRLCLSDQIIAKRKWRLPNCGFMKARLILSERLAQIPMPCPPRHRNSLQLLYMRPCNSSMAVTMCFHQELYLILQKQVPGGVLQGFLSILKDPKTYPLHLFPVAHLQYGPSYPGLLKSDHHILIQQPRLSSILYLTEPTASHKKYKRPLV